MNYSEPLVNQIAVFCKAVGTGVLLGIIYDVLSAVRMLFGERKCVYVFFDTAYFLAASLVSFFFMVLYNSGQVRINLMLAELFGGTAFHFSFGKYMLDFYSAHLVRIRKTLFRIVRPLYSAGRKSCCFLKEKLYSRTRREHCTENKGKKSKKISNIGKILLKNKNKSV